MNERPEELIDGIDSLQSFLEFVKALELDERLDQPRQYDSGTRGWENGTIAAFLEAMHAWATASGSLPSTAPTWKDVAELFLAGKYYE